MTRSPSHRLRVVYYFAYPDTLAGAARSLFELITNLPDEVEGIVMVAAEGKVAASCRDQGIECRVVNAGPSLMTFGKRALQWPAWKRGWVLGTEFAPYTARLAWELRRLGADIVHANDSRGALLVGAAARLAGLPLVSHLRGRKAYSGIYWRSFELLSDRIITVCHALHEDVTPSSRHKATTVYDGTGDLRAGGMHALSSPDALGWLEGLRQRGHVVVSAFASVAPFKGYHHLLAAIARLPEAARKRAIFVGVGATADSCLGYEAWLFDEMRRLGVDSFTLAGWQDDPVAFYAVTDVAVLPSVARETLRMGSETLHVEGNEGFPRAHLEAMSMGIPVVGTRIGGVAEQIVDGTTGWVVPPGNDEALASALHQLIDDPELRARMGRAGRSRVLEKFSTERFVQGTLEVYRGCSRRAPAIARVA